MLKNTTQTYGSVNKFFHWLIALLVIVMLVVGYLMNSGPIYNLHKLTGLTILILVVLRILWVLNNPRPKLPASVGRFEYFLSRLVQGLLYVCLLAMPLTGWAMATAFGYLPHIGAWSLPMPGIPIDPKAGGFFADVHATIAIILIALISLHTLGALKHHFWDKDDVLSKMLPAKKT